MIYKWSIRWINWNQKLKLKTKNQNIFCWCKWKFDNFLIHFWIRGTRKRFLEGEKSFLFPLFQKCIKKSKCQQQKIWYLVFSFMYLVSVYPMDRTQKTNIFEEETAWPFLFSNYNNNKKKNKDFGYWSPTEVTKLAYVYVYNSRSRI